MNKLIKKIVLLKKMLLLMLAMVMMTSVLFGMVACEKEPVDPVYEIKLYDDNWVELVKNTYENGSYFYSRDKYEYEYDGSKKAFNAIGYKDGVEFYRLDYKTTPYLNDNIIILSVNRAATPGNLPMKVGRYSLVYSFPIRISVGPPEGNTKDEWSFASDVMQAVTIYII